ncbi:immunoglobulin-like domain-containing protein [Aminipila terrae]|uniref:Atrophied bacterial Ig domain-containing protein n=1 Tax=Aminipila terrae TaxID=2697030 RepID=A0A6P1ME47_9FIRM|nr:immunoglobulin-like domain-containing protein [Aminipila terrae]QHI71403.1 hypothetical protein Ami3637_02495 [Aminipila terrae]
MAAYIVAKLSTGQAVSEDEWKKLAGFQMEDGQYKRTASASSANGEATAMAAIALDYGKRLESDANAKSVFLRLAEANQADRTAGKEAEEAVFKTVADLKTTVDSAATVDDIVALIKEKEDTVSLVSSNEKVVSSADKEVHPLQPGEPDNTVQLKIIIKSGNCATVIRTKVFNIEPEDKTFPFGKNMELLKQYYKSYPLDKASKGINKCHQAFSLASLMNDPQLGGIADNTQFYGTGGYYSDDVTFRNPEASAVLDWIAMDKDPRQYIKVYPSTGLTEQADLISEMISGQYDNGSFSNPSSTLGYPVRNCVVNTMALEAYFGGKDWGNEQQAGTHYGRIGAIEDIFSHMIDAKDDKYAEERQDINVEGGRALAEIDRDGSLEIDGQVDQSLAIILFSRWLNDGTQITVKGETKPLKEFAQKEIDGILKTLKFVYDLDNSKNYGTEEYAYYISALVASGHKDKVDEYGLWNKLRNGRADNGAFYINPVHDDMPWDPATMGVAMAMGDYQNGKSILASMTYDTSILTDAEAVQKDTNNIKLPDIATEKISLPVKGYYGSTIVWESSNSDVINSSTGNIVRPEQGQMDAVVSLTANIKRGEASQTKTFLVKVLAIADQNNEKGTEDYDSLSIPLFVTGDIELPTTGKNGSNIVWESSKLETITNEGRVTLGDTDTKLTLKATVTNGTFIKVKEFQVTVSRQLSDDVVDKAVAQLRSYYNHNRDLTSSYWDIFAAKSVLGDDFDNYNFKLYDVKSHRASSTWQGTDYGAVVLQILAQGDNPIIIREKTMLKNYRNF